MPSTYSIVIQNKSGSHENYSIYAAVPEVSGVFDIAASPSVIYSVLVPKGGRSEIELSLKYSAVWGTYSTSSNAGGQAIVRQSQPVDLVALGLDGNISTQGSKVALKVNDERQPQFASPITSDDGTAGSFKLVTSAFESAEAKESGWFVGVSMASDVGPGILGSWTPRPNVEYEITPRLQFYIVPGSRQEVGTVINPEKYKDRALTVDLMNRPGRNRVIIAHKSNGSLVITVD